jgi:protein-ribulosamine 3-kinase
MFNINIPYEEILRQAIGMASKPLSCGLIVAGNLNQASFIHTETGSYFLKTNKEPSADIFEKERNGLDLLRKNTSLTIPETHGHGKIGGLNYLLMEWIPGGKRRGDYWEELALELSQLHKTQSPYFGLEEDNYIAVLPQINNRCSTWDKFFIENRLEKPLAMALGKGLVDSTLIKKIRKIYPEISALFPPEKPSLVHGDLWSGNIMVNENGQPVLIDPAVYFGHREMDLAFSKLFGGFPERFYAAYQEILPTAPQLNERIDLYNLYPLLIHVVLFGRSYGRQIKAIVDRYS